MSWSGPARRGRPRSWTMSLPRLTPRLARGYRNREHFKTSIYLHLGGLQLYPATP